MTWPSSCSTILSVTQPSPSDTPCGRKKNRETLPTNELHLQLLNKRMHDYFQEIVDLELGALKLNLPWSLRNVNAVVITGNLWSEAYAGIVLPVFHWSQNHISVLTCLKYYKSSMKLLSSRICYSYIMLRVSILLLSYWKNCMLSHMARCHLATTDED